MAHEALERDLRTLLGAAAVYGGDRTRFEQGYRYGNGRAAAVVRPQSVHEVSAIVRFCHPRSIPIVPQGAHSGLVAAGTPQGTGDQLVLSLERLRGVTEFSPLDRTATCKAGTLLSELNAHVHGSGLRLPIDLGADPSIGGMVATNTGGARLLRYGDMRHNLLGLEAVLADADGTIVSDLNGLRKDNSGVDLKQLFIGTGGAFGVVTAACVNLHRLPRQTASALVVPSRLDAVPHIIDVLEEHLGEMLIACEGMSRNAMDAALRHHPALRSPFPAGSLPYFALLIEAGSTIAPNGSLDVEMLLGEALWPCMEGDDAVIADAIMGRGPEFWMLRHAISDGLKMDGKVLAFDISVRRSRLPELLTILSALVAEMFPQLRICDFGHFGDGGVHFNLVLPHGQAPSTLKEDELRNTIYRRLVDDFGGSISAEHGIGPYNLEYYRRFVPGWKRGTTASLKRLLDPMNVLSNTRLE
jgi:FAD/FMN-containing dehydrogenases